MATKIVYSDMVIRRDVNNLRLVHILSAKTKGEGLCSHKISETTLKPGSYELCVGCRRLYDVGMLGRI